MTTTIDLGTPEPVRVKSRRGSPWTLPLQFADLPGDFSAVTDVICVLKRSPGGDRTLPTVTLTADLTQKASLLITLRATAEQATIEPGSYKWEMQFVAPGAWCDGWAPLGTDKDRGVWEVLDRQAH